KLNDGDRECPCFTWNKTELLEESSGTLKAGVPESSKQFLGAVGHKDNAHKGAKYEVCPVFVWTQPLVEHLLEPPFTRVFTLRHSREFAEYVLVLRRLSARSSEALP